MNKEKTNLIVIFDGIEETLCGLNKIYYHKVFNQNNGKKRTIGFSALVKDKDLVEKLKKLRPKTEIEVETETIFQTDEMETILIDFKETTADITSAKNGNIGRRMPKTSRLETTIS